MRSAIIAIKLLNERLTELENRVSDLELQWRDRTVLTPYEQRILSLMLQGLKTPDIAKALNCESKSIYYYRRNIHRKLGTDGNMQKLILTAYRLGLAKLENEEETGEIENG